MMSINRERATNTKILAIFGVAGLSLGLGMNLVSDTFALTYQSKVGIGFTLEPAINVSLSGASLKIMDLMPGAASDSNAITINVSTNNANGYVLNTTVGSDNVANNNGAIYNTRKLIHNTYTSSDNTAISGDTGTKPVFTSIAYNANLAGITESNQWGYSYRDLGSSETWSNYNGLPLYNDTANIATLKSKETPSAENGDNLEFKIAARASNGQTSGEYNNVINFLVVGNPDQGGEQTTEPGCISYYPNGGNVEGTMGCQPITETDTSATLLASNFSRAGYGFAGWSDKYDYATNPNAKFYGPNETITFTAGQYTSPNNGLSLYAVWVKSQGSLQDTTKVAELCGVGANVLTTAPTDGTANLSSVSALTDQRNNETYAIARLADGNCWMIENLRLESEDTVGNNRFDSSVTNQSLAQGYGTSATYGNFGGLADPESANFKDSTTANSLYYSGTQSGDATINIGTSNNPGYRMPRYNNLNTPTSFADRPQNPTSNTFTGNNTTVGMYSYGNYYTWHAAIADTTHYNSGDHGTTSLCPTGWRLPPGNTTTLGFGKLDMDMGGTGAYQTTAEASNRWRKYPANFLYSGFFDSSLALDRGSYGVYWSSTAYDNYTSSGLGLGSSLVIPGANNNKKYYGFSVRCMVSAGT